MKRRLLEIVCCPVCGKSLVCTEARLEVDMEILEGELRCGKDHSFPISAGVPRLLPLHLTSDAQGVTSEPPPVSKSDATLKKTMRSFGYQWNVFSEMYPDWEENSKSYFDPLVEDRDFGEKLILDAGCGFGRHAHYVAKRGGEVVAMDISEAVAAAHRNTQDLDNVHVVQGDIYNPPLKPFFDLAYCIGVIQHLPTPKVGFGALAKLVKPKGGLFVWVYGKRRGVYLAIDFMRKGSTHLPMRVLYHFTFLLNILSHVCFSLPYKTLRAIPLCERLAAAWPFTRYADLPMRVGHADWFDRLSVPSTVYFSREEVGKWYAEAKLIELEIVSRDGIGWCAFGKRAGVAKDARSTS